MPRTLPWPKTAKQPVVAVLTKPSPSRAPAHRARKRFGQNFLVDDNIIGRIIATINPQSDDTLVEIGPGQGAITGPLLEHCSTLSVVELDRDLIELLRNKFLNHSGLQIYQGDALKTDFGQFQHNSKPLRVVGNLPYNISTPLIFHLLDFVSNTNHNTTLRIRGGIRDMHFMLQKEVVDRMAATPGQKSYGRLSVMVQYYCQVQPLFLVPPRAFQPMPKVESAIVRLIPFQEPPYPALDIEHLKRLVNACFQQRRKTLRNTLKQLVRADQMDKLDIDLAARPETLSVADFVYLSNLLNHDN